jgi:hypothetical protein
VVKTEGAAAFSPWVKIGQPRRSSSLRKEATVAEAAPKIPATFEPDLHLGKAAARRRGCIFLGRDQQGGEPGGRDYRALHQEENFFSRRSGQRIGPSARRESLAVVTICRCGRQYAARIGACGVCRRPAPLDAEELALMRWLDEQYLATPFVARPAKPVGSRPVAAMLRLHARQVNRKRGCSG